MNRQSHIEELLERDGVIVYKTRGVSMRPMLKQNRDLVTVRKFEGRLKKYDVPSKYLELELTELSDYQ